MLCHASLLGISRQKECLTLFILVWYQVSTLCTFTKKLSIDIHDVDRKEMKQTRSCRLAIRHFDMEIKTPKKNGPSVHKWTIRKNVSWLIQSSMTTAGK